MDLPLHPMIVHLPIAVTLLLPLAVVAWLWRGRVAAAPRRAWGYILVLFTALALSASLAVSTGERDEDAVERIVPEAALEAHEDAANVFLALTWTAAAIAALGLLPGVAGRVARYSATGLTALLLIAAVRVGHAGGELVYRYGGAQAHVTAAGSTGSISMPVPRGHDDD